jgi:hypothetical protein
METTAKNLLDYYFFIPVVLAVHVGPGFICAPSHLLSLSIACHAATGDVFTG